MAGGTRPDDEAMEEVGNAATTCPKELRWSESAFAMFLGVVGDSSTLDARYSAVAAMRYG